MWLCFSTRSWVCCTLSMYQSLKCEWKVQKSIAYTIAGVFTRLQMSAITLGKMSGGTKTWTSTGGVAPKARLSPQLNRQAGGDDFWVSPLTFPYLFHTWVAHFPRLWNCKTAALAHEPRLQFQQQKHKSKGGNGETQTLLAASEFTTSANHGGCFFSNHSLNWHGTFCWKFSLSETPPMAFLGNPRSLEHRWDELVMCRTHEDDEMGKIVNDECRHIISYRIIYYNNDDYY